METKNIFFVIDTNLSSCEDNASWWWWTWLVQLHISVSAKHFLQNYFLAFLFVSNCQNVVQTLDKRLIWLFWWADFLLRFTSQMLEKNCWFDFSPSSSSILETRSVWRNMSTLKWFQFKNLKLVFAPFFHWCMFYLFNFAEGL